MAHRHTVLLALRFVLIGLLFHCEPNGAAARTGVAQLSKSPTAQDFPIRLEIQYEIRFTAWELVTAVAWSPAGEVMAISAGNAIYLYRTEGWEQAARMEVGALSHGLAFSADGRWLAAGSRDGKLRLWEVVGLMKGGQLAPGLTLVAHRKGVNDVRFSPAGRLLASGGNDAIARFWDYSRGELVGMTIGGSFAVPSIDFSPDGQVLAVVNGRLVRLREVGTERIVGTFQSDAPLHRVAFNPDGSLIAASANDNLIRVWRTSEAYRTANPVYPKPLLLSGHSGAAGGYQALVWKIVFSPDGRLLASAGGDGTVRLWESASGVLLASQPAHLRGAADIAFRPDGRAIASGGLDGSVKIWILIEGESSP